MGISPYPTVQAVQVCQFSDAIVQVPLRRYIDRLFAIGAFEYH